MVSASDTFLYNSLGLAAVFLVTVLFFHFLRCRYTYDIPVNVYDCVIGDCIGLSMAPDILAEKIEFFELLNSLYETNGNFDSWNSCKQLGNQPLI